MSGTVNVFGEVHDAWIGEYRIDFRENVLEMTLDQPGSRIQLRFSGLLAHHFENVIATNILFEIEEVTASHFLQKQGAFLKDKLRFGFPISRNDCRNLEQLEAYLQGYRFFRFDASLGLIGFVIAKDIQINDQSA